jgi:hypothetical protein
MRDFPTVYEEIERRKSIAKKGVMSFDLELDVWSRQPRASP